ncbi:hypothetical protein BDA96_10G338200 [Sorghum bicolor]|uniref:Secreted protein n=1 Tax=Sorghum bicolor TaxID=4558 RepID=A0A921Q6T1_SORBI|nr:hypothetical protein BDA96_10G338200 [Sorghum bicolor]
MIYYLLFLLFMCKLKCSICNLQTDTKRAEEKRSGPWLALGVANQEAMESPAWSTLGSGPDANHSNLAVACKRRAMDSLDRDRVWIASRRRGRWHPDRPPTGRGPRGSRFRSHSQQTRRAC